MREPGVLETISNRRALLAEGPAWDVETQTLLWVDIHRREVHRWSWETGLDETRVFDAPVTAVALCGDGRLVGVSETDFVWVGEARLDPIGSATPKAPRLRMNDGKCDPVGRFLAGTMTIEQTPGGGALYRLERDLTITPLLTDVTLSNGLGWSPDGRRFYFVDTPTRRIDVFDYDVASGAIANRRCFVDLATVPGRPDGMCVDAEGCVWVAMARGGAVRRFSPGGAALDVIRVPADKVTSCAFGGPDLDELYITTACVGLSEIELDEQPLAGAVFRVKLDVKGLPAARFDPLR